MIRDEFSKLFRCPATHEPVFLRNGQLVNQSGTHRYCLSDAGIPLFAGQPVSSDALRQQQHYDRVCDSYLENLTYPHTREYFAYLDRVLLRHVDPGSLGRVLEVCCGRGEALKLLGDRIDVGVGVDISHGMLRIGKQQLQEDRFCLAQADATDLPFHDEQFDNAFTLGGIHHVNDREQLFSEVYRVLKPGGRFIWREPVSDFFLWQLLRAVIYKLSPALDSSTERPLRQIDTCPLLKAAGFDVTCWKTYGFFGFCLFMNSDVLVFNRWFRLIPGIRQLTRLFAAFDDWVVSRSWLRHVGLQVVGVAEKPARADGRRVAAPNRVQVRKPAGSLVR